MLENSRVTTGLPASVYDLLMQAGALGAAEEGQIHLISVSAIREAVAERWGRRREAVEEYVLRAFRRDAADNDFIALVNDVDFILIQPSRTPLEALGRASKLMRETLNYFLGKAVPEAIRVAVVDRLGEGVVEASAVAESDLERASGRPGHSTGDTRQGSPPWERFGQAADQRSGVVLIKRPNLPSIRAMFYLQPIWSLRRSAVVSFLIRSVVFIEDKKGELIPPGDDDLTSQCRLELALRRIRFAEECWSSAAGAAPALHLSLSLGSIRHSSQRRELLARLKLLRDNPRNGPLFLELGDAPEAFPLLTLSSLVCQLKPYVRGVLLRTDNSDDVVRWRSSGLSGVVWAKTSTTTQDLQRLRGFAAAAHAAQLAAAFYGVSTNSQFMQSWGAGLTHLSGDLITSAFGDGADARRFEPRQLYIQSARLSVG